MFKDALKEYVQVFKDGPDIARVQILYLVAVPLFLVGQLIYLARLW